MDETGEQNREGDPRGEVDSEAEGLRKIIHVDMDAFFASVEQRDNPELRGKPVAVGGSSGRGVVAAASYEARQFGVRSAMPSVTAKRLCPDLVFVKSRFDAYREASQQIREIFRFYTPLVEPLSLDEAYLDITEDLQGMGSATGTAQAIRRLSGKKRASPPAPGSATTSFSPSSQATRTSRTACAFRPGEGAAFVSRCRSGAFTASAKGWKRWRGWGSKPARTWRARTPPGCGRISAVSAIISTAPHGASTCSMRVSRIRKSVGGERTFSQDQHEPDELRETLERIIAIVWERIERSKARGRTITLKMSTTTSAPSPGHNRCCATCPGRTNSHP